MILKIIKSYFWLPLFLLIIVAINFVGWQYHTRIDLTAEKRFTLSYATKTLLKKVDEPITIHIFLTGNLPSGFKQLATSTNDVLNSFKQVTGNKIQFSFTNVDATIDGTEKTYADTLNELGLYPINLTSQLKEGQQQQNIYPFALLQYKDKTTPVELYKGKTPLVNFAELNSAEALLEYNFANAIATLIEKQQTIIGYATGNGEPSLTDYSTYDLVENVLKPKYNLFTFNLASTQFLPAQMKALIIVKPSIGFTDEQKLKLDQYVMAGGRILLFADRLNAELDSLKIKNEVTAFDRNLQLNDLLFNYGLRINADLVMDLQCDFLPFDVSGNGQFELLPWNYFPVMGAATSHPINKGIGYIAGRFINSIDTVEAEGITKTVLLNSSANARTIGAPAIISSAENVNAPQDDKFKKANIQVAVLLEGKFTSMFTNRLTQALSDSLQINNMPFLTSNSISNKIIVVADGDIPLNSLVKSNPIPMGFNAYTYSTQREFPFANKLFVQNCLDYLIDENNLSEAKSKDYVARLLDNKKVEEQKIFWQIITIVLPIAIVLLFAIIFQWLRTKKYNK